MKTDLIALAEAYQQKFSVEPFNKVNIQVTPNTKRIEASNGSINFKISSDNETVSTTMYIVEREKTMYLIFVNDASHDIVFNNIGVDPVEKSDKYITKYIERSVQRLLGIFPEQRQPRNNRQKR